MRRIQTVLLGMGLLFVLCARSIASSESSVSLEVSERCAVENHPSVLLAQEEVEVSKLKMREARRALGPNLTLKAEQTNGASVEELGTPDFTEKSYGLHVSQPLFQGGRLYKVYRQSYAQWESVQAKLQKAEQEALYTARETFWNYLKAQSALDIYQKALADLKKEKTMADKLRKKDVINKKTALTIAAQYNQAHFTVQGAEAELESRLWQWTAALGLKEPPTQKPENKFLIVSIEDISLPDCLEVAEKNQPDLLVQRKSAEAAFYGHLAGKSLYWPKLNVNGSYGRSGGAFKGERLELREDWQAGVQLSQYFGGSTLNVTGMQQKTSPKIGQTTRTESKTGTASLGLFDSYKQKTEKKEAEFTFHQAKVQFDKVKMDVANGVREAYANYKKAISQLKIAENDFELAKTEHKITKIKSRSREVPLSERAVTRNRMAQAQTALVEAKAAHNIMAAALHRAMGIK